MNETKLSVSMLNSSNRGITLLNESSRGGLQSERQFFEGKEDEIIGVLGDNSNVDEDIMSKDNDRIQNGSNKRSRLFTQ